jgi:hypothetical protein
MSRQETITNQREHRRVALLDIGCGLLRECWRIHESEMEERLHIKRKENAGDGGWLQIVLD